MCEDVAKIGPIAMKNRVLRYIRIQELFVIFLCSIIIFISIFFFIYHQILSKGDGSVNVDFVSMQCDVLSSRLSQEVDDLYATRSALLKEISYHESIRDRNAESVTTLDLQIKQLTTERDRISEEVSRISGLYSRIQEEMRYARKDIQIRVLPPIDPPEPDTGVISSKLPEKESCGVETCVHFSRCPVSKPFTFYLHDPYGSPSLATHELRLYQAFEKSPERIEKVSDACMSILVAFTVDSSLEKYLQELPMWNDGHNLIIVLPHSMGNGDHWRSFGKAAVLTSDSEGIRHDYDFTVPFLTRELNEALISDFEDLGRVVPIERRTLLSFHSTESLAADPYMSALHRSAKSPGFSESVNISFGCLSPGLVDGGVSTDLCADKEDRWRNLNESTFVVIYGKWTQVRLVEALAQGAVPVVLGSSESLPLYPFIDWSSVSIIVPPGRVTELLFIIKTFSHNDIAGMRIQGRKMYLQYLSSYQKMTETFLSAWRHKLLMVSRQISPAFQSSQSFTISPQEQSAFLAPIDATDPPQFTSNFSFAIDWRRSWSNFPGPFAVYPTTPFKPVLPTEAQFIGSQPGFRPLNQGKGGDGRYFAQSLGGNEERESFTIVILAYCREEILMEIIKGFKNLQYLHSVLVVWNTPANASQSLVWPDIHVPIHVVRGPKNSLNNRFLPYDQIRTEAVLSLDDDVFLTHEEILFSFRVWRENRDRIVGLPGRLHSWNSESSSWFYNRELSCELSLVLTGAAFFHKYYMYVYTNDMPAVIRDKVDEYMNCEDIAFNFLVSHITRKPPVKTTSKRTFYCDQCGENTLWMEQTHISERDTCINFFCTVYGYNPLMYTQYRADSVLYHNRVSDNEVKCFARV